MDLSAPFIMPSQVGVQNTPPILLSFNIRLVWWEKDKNKPKRAPFISAVKAQESLKNFEVEDLKMGDRISLLGVNEAGEE